MPKNNHKNVTNKGDVTTSFKFWSVNMFLQPPSGRQGQSEGTGVAVGVDILT